MKFSIQMFLLILFSSNSCQNKTCKNKNPKFDRITINGCERGKKEAIQDIDLDDLGYYFFGDPSPRYNTWMRTIKKEFLLKTKGGGGIFFEEGKCYNDVMRNNIKKKFGVNAFERINEKVDSLYHVGLGDRHAEFIGGQKELIKFLYCEINESFLSDKENNYLIIAQLNINNIGIPRVDTLRLHNIPKSEYSNYKKETKRIISLMPSWNPAIVNKATIESKFILPIKFTNQAKMENCL